MGDEVNLASTEINKRKLGKDEEHFEDCRYRITKESSPQKRKIMSKNDKKYD